MAYLTHGAYRSYSLNSQAAAARLSRLVGAAFVAIVAATAIIALSSGGDPRSDAAMSVGAKADRMAVAAAAPADQAMAGDFTTAGGVQTGVDATGAEVFRRDEAAQTTTVVRGAKIPLGAASPYLDGAK